MDVISGNSHSTPVVHVTREVRWFRNGPVPDDVIDWFTASGTLGSVQQRLDRYDLTAARNDVGAKQRGAVALDTKHRRGFEPDVDLAPGMCGCVEDWVKTSTTLDPSTAQAAACNVPVHKELITRTYRIDPARTDSGSDAGCVVQLASITVRDQQAWTLCCETFGPSHLAGEALRAGIDGLLADTPLPAGLSFSESESCGYPAWLASLDAGA